MFSCGYCRQVAPAVVGIGLFLSRIYEGGHLVVGIVSVCGQGGGLAGVVFFGGAVAQGIVGVFSQGLSVPGHAGQAV